MKYGNLLQALKVHTQPVFIILDEHNEMLRDTEGRPWLRDWTRYDYVSAVCFPFALHPNLPTTK